ncbi:MAG: maleylpyruvate isomerase family mycothiol-dependent enzyme [Dehalococcoidia bacterium]|jgi:uncharacterized protein (TIGR03083 family)|nr:maleylpyruvate isomerase family mycothiol-dependent enzyme [Dehalococcoidia bacterium]MEE2926952.1 maleylpyruvate isomerase family mycothiol-dependent enzyme [Chloroflexota bacterium]|tara:strand:- start:1316 stop:2149 length:834 start_codon:yes stop_codon:yes gene_type:complete
MVTPEQRVNILQAEAESFKTYLSSLPAEAWNQPSACEGWTVADVVGHLNGQNFASRVARGLADDASPPEGAPLVEHHDEDRFAEDIFQRALSNREEHGENLLESFIPRLDESVQVFNTVGPNDWEKPCYWPPGPEPVRTLLDMRIAELTMHAWDIRSTFDAGYRLSDDSVRVLMQTVDRAVRRAFRPDVDIQSEIRYRFEVMEPFETAYDVVMAAQGTHVEPSGKQGADVTFRCDGETYVLVMYGRLSPEDATAQGRLTFQGDSELAGSFGRRFKGG